MSSNFQPNRKRRAADDAGDSSSRAEDERQPWKEASGPAGNAYHGATANDHARAHFGNVINNYGPPDKSNPDADNERKVTALMETLAFDRMDFCLAGIHRAHLNTCHWIVEKPAYIRWRDPSLRASHNGMLWIKGKAGVGKSTMMRFLLEHLAKDIPDYCVISFFFNARGDSLERSLEGMYRSLLHQILKNVPEAQATITIPEIYSKNGQPWEMNVLRSLFHEAVASLREERLICVIDALDEGEHQDIRSMVEFMYELAETTESSFEICFASRHYPNITVPACEELILESQTEHAQDIGTYISSKLVVRDKRLKDELQAILEEKSQDVFLWTVLVTRKLNEQYDDGASPRELLDAVSEIPADLTVLLRSTITGGATDSRFLPTMIWVLVARPLNVKELYDAIQVSTDQSVLEGRGTSDRDTDWKQRFILSASKGLVEFTMAKLWGLPPGAHPTVEVRFIHETVREHLLTEGLSVLSQSLRTTPEGSSHAMVATWCQTYIRLASLWLHDAETTKNDWIMARTGLFMYVKQHALAHMESAYILGATQMIDSQDFPLSQWIQVFNFDKSFNDEGSAQIPQLDTSANLLFLLLVDFRETPVKAILDNYAASQQIGRQCVPVDNQSLNHSMIGRDLNVWCGGEYCSLIGAAAALGNIDIMRILLDQGADPNVRGRSGTLLELAIFMRKTDVVSLLLDRGSDLNHQQMWDGQLQHTALTAAVRYPSARSEKGEILELLFSRGACAKVQELSRLLLVAAEKGSTAHIRILVTKGANPNIRSHDGRSALHLPSDGPLFDPDDVTLALLECGADVNAIGGQYGTALITASFFGFHRSVAVLLRFGADDYYRHEYYGTALDTARMEKNHEVVQLLCAAQSGQHLVPT